MLFSDKIEGTTNCLQVVMINLEALFIFEELNDKSKEELEASNDEQKKKTFMYKKITKPWICNDEDAEEEEEEEERGKVERWI